MDYHLIIDNAIALYLDRKGLTEKQLAEMMNMPENIFNQKRCGKEEFTLFETIQLSEILGITLDEITGNNKIDQPKSVHYCVSNPHGSRNMNVLEWNDPTD